MHGDPAPEDDTLARDVAVLTAANVVDAGLSLLQNLFVARLLQPHLYGTAVLLMTYPAMLFAVLDPRASDATVKYLGEFAGRRERRKASAMCVVGYAVDLTTALLVLGVVALTATWAARRIVGAPDLAVPMIVFTAAFVPRALCGTSTAALMTLGRFHAIAATTVAQAIVRTMLVIGLVSAGFGVSGVVYGSAVAIGLSGVLVTAVAAPLVVRTWGTIGVRAAWNALGGHRRSIFHFLVWNDVNTFLGSIVKQCDVLFLGYLRGPTDAGYYRLAKSAGSALGLLVAPLQSTTFPRLTGLVGQGRDAEVRTSVRRYALRIGAPLGACTMLTLPLLPHVIPVVLGEEYRPAATTTQIVLAGAAIWLACFWVRPYFMAIGQIREFTRLYSISLIPYALSFLLLAPTFGAQGMAVGFLGHNLILFGLPVLSMLR